MSAVAADGTRGNRSLRSRRAVILVADADTRSALAVVRSLGRAGFIVHTCAARRVAIAASSRYSRRFHPLDCEPEDSNHAVEVAAICQRIGARVVLPTTDVSMSALLRDVSVLYPTVLPFSDFETFARVSNKAEVLATAERLGIATPQSLTLSVPGDLAGWPDVFPAAIKSAGISAARVRGRYAGSRQALEREVVRIPEAAYPLLVQQRVVGPGIGVFLLRWEGQTLAAFAHRRLREQPPSGGMSIYCESIALDLSLKQSAERLLDAFNWKGVAMVEFKMDRATGVPFLMEINGRFWGSLQLAVDAGVDFPVLLARAALGDATRHDRGYIVGQRLRNFWADVDHAVAVVTRSREHLLAPSDLRTGIRGAIRFFERGTTERNETARFTDPMPFVVDTALWVQHRTAALLRLVKSRGNMR